MHRSANRYYLPCQKRNETKRCATSTEILDWSTHRRRNRPRRHTSYRTRFSERSLWRRRLLVSRLHMPLECCCLVFFELRTQRSPPRSPNGPTETTPSEVILASAGGGSVPDKNLKNAGEPESTAILESLMPMPGRRRGRLYHNAKLLTIRVDAATAKDRFRQRNDDILWARPENLYWPTDFEPD